MESVLKARTEQELLKLAAKFFYRPVTFVGGLIYVNKTAVLAGYVVVPKSKYIHILQPAKGK